MNEIASRVALSVVEAARAQGVPPPRLLEGIGVSYDELRRGRRMDWDPFARLCDRFCELLGDRTDAAMEQSFIDGAPELQALAGLFVSPAAFVDFFVERMLPSAYSNLELTYRRDGDRLIDLDVRIPDGYRESLGFMRATTPGLRTLTLRLGLPLSRVEADVSPRHGRYRIQLPPSRTLGSRVARASRAFAAREALSAIDAKLQALGAAQQELRDKEARLAQEVGAARRAEESLRAIAGTLSSAAFLVSPTSVEPVGEASARWLAREGELLRARLIAAACGSAADPSIELSPAGGEPPRWLALVRDGAAGFAHRLEEARGRWELTPRQVEVLAGIAQGEQNRDVAQALGCSERTVEVHVAALLERTGQPSRTALASAFWAVVT